MINPAAIQIVPTVHPGAYNMSLLGGTPTLKAFRWHPNPKHWRTELAMEAYGTTLPILMPQKYAEHSHEDPRLFIYNGSPHLSATISRTRVNGQSVDPCIQIVGELVWGKQAWTLKNWRQPIYGRNDMTSTEKNWCFGWFKDKLVFTYQAFPHHVVCQMGDGNTVETSWRTESPKCNFGVYRGGTQTFHYKGKRLRFCHVVQNNPKAKLYWGYSLAAYLFDVDPPFRIVAVSQQPILTGNEAYEPNCPHWKPRVCIPYGAIADGDGWKVSVGLNDCQCAIVTVRPEDLNL